MFDYTHWRVFKVKAGHWAGRWCAINYSVADGFLYEQRVFDTHAEAHAHVQNAGR